MKMQTEFSGTSVIFVKVAPGYVERTLTTLRGKAERGERRGRPWATRHRGRGQLPGLGCPPRIPVRGPAAGPRPKLPELSGALELEAEPDERAPDQRVRAHPHDEPEAGDQR